MKKAIVTLACCVLALNGCTSPGFRLNGNFNSQAFGAPQQFPIPSPPNDQFTWTVRQLMASVIVANPAGGKWVLTTPTREFVFVDPDRRRLVLIASSEPFNIGGAQIRGTFSIRLTGPAKVDFGVRAVRGNVESFIGGGQVFAFPFTPGGEVGILQNAADMDNFPDFDYREIPSLVSFGSYTPGQTAQFFYTINQANQTFRLSAGGGAQGADEYVYSFSGPIQKLDLWLFLRSPGSRTVVLTNDVTMEEL
jgi:hypothetical protein